MIIKKFLELVSELQLTPNLFIRLKLFQIRADLTIEDR